MTFEIVEHSTHDSVRKEKMQKVDMERARVLIIKAKENGHPLYDDKAGRRSVIKFLKTHNPEDLGNWAHLASSFINFANTMWL